MSTMILNNEETQQTERPTPSPQSSKPDNEEQPVPVADMSKEK